MQLSIILISLIFSVCSQCLDLSNEFFNKYSGLKSLKSGPVIDGVKKIETPPTETTYSWYLSLYNPEIKSSYPDIRNVENCQGSQLCGLTSVLDKKGVSLLSEVISIPTDVSPKYITELQENGSNDDTNGTSNYFKAIFSEVKWGNNLIGAEIKFICDKDSTDTSNHLNVVSWDKANIQLEFKSPLACESIEGSEPPTGSKPPYGDDDSSGWGFFTWLFILLVIIFASYIIGNAWINVNRVNGNEFLNELIDVFIDTVTRIPQFIREIVSKFSGSNDRGGYSAV
ncbi:unnamed protein product [[Candida] boidinii]|uniref:Unnamed protein product n=1 Tax=Candida boidinii TaxID=5477 RepID=A0ACB5TG17_CANBO|nr:unnamed protein product [[Candida] boidinii]GME87689.1 unnamed protein product [[Candida] boidinii]